MIFPHDDDYDIDEHFDVTLIVFKKHARNEQKPSIYDDEYH